ncbi:hypothetical protein BGZ73_003585 [Actinomortierella ambigua]|nr:hypothetical protein BGZ73_003585 [Actinomortierella ambigua]
MSLRLVNQIGEDDFGHVFVGRWRDQPCVAKRFYSRGQEHLIMEDISILQDLRHCNIVQFLAAENFNGSLTMIIDCPKGGTLQAAIQNRLLFNEGWPKKVQIATEIAKGLAFLHVKGIFHRTLKSGNVLLTQSLEVKLCDFGSPSIKVNLPPSISGNQRPQDPLRWMAPEVHGYEPRFSTKSDMYALGIVMWEMAANCTIPFRNVDSYAIANLVQGGAREEIPEVTPTVYGLWILKCWRPDPRTRPEAVDIFRSSIYDICYASRSHRSTGSLMNIPNPSSLIGGARPLSVGRSIMNSGLRGRPTLLKKLDELQGEYARRAMAMIGTFVSDDIPDCIVEELELMVTPASKLLLDADNGSAEAQYRLGRKLCQALGVKADYAKGSQFLKRAADQGHMKAQYCLGMSLWLSVMDPHYDERREHWLTMAAAQGFTLADTMLRSLRARSARLTGNELERHLAQLGQRAAEGDRMASLLLGEAYLKIPPLRNFGRARQYLKQAVDRGSATAAVHLGDLHLEGCDMPKDLTKARGWYAYAASRWCASGQFKLGMMLHRGHGIPRDRGEASIHIKRSAEQGDRNARQACRELGM